MRARSDNCLISCIFTQLYNPHSMHRSCFSHKRYSSLFCKYSIHLHLEIPIGLCNMLGKPYWVGLSGFFICVNNKALLGKVSHWPLQTRHPSSHLCLMRAASSEITRQSLSRLSSSFQTTTNHLGRAGLLCAVVGSVREVCTYVPAKPASLSTVLASQDLICFRC